MHNLLDNYFGAGFKGSYSARISFFNFLDRRYSHEQKSPENETCSRKFIEKNERIPVDEQSRIGKKGPGVIYHH